MFTPPQNLEQQSFETLYDSDDCWDFSGVTLLEIYLNSLWTTLPQTHKDFCIQNNYCDSQGNFALSRRFIAIQSGVKNNGNFQLDFWTGTPYSVDTIGIIPRSMLDFVPVGFQDPTYASFVNDFFNPDAVTQEMLSLGKQFLIYFNITAQDVSTFDWSRPVQVGVPIPQNVATWNQAFVKWDGSTVTKHAVVKLGQNPDGTQPIVDSYIPYLKTLSSDYPMNIITVPTVTVKTLTIPSQPSVSLSVLQQFINLLKSIGTWIIN